MELIIEGRGKNFGKVHQARITEIKRLLKTLPENEDAEALQVLAEALLVYSYSHALLKRSGPVLLEWFKTFLEFLRQRDEDVKTSLFLPDGSSSSFLLIAAPDVPYLVDSLKTILQRLPQRALIISHPILNLQRSNGLLSALGEKVEVETRESFMLVRFEGARDLDTKPIEDEIRRVFQIALAVGRQRVELKEKIAQMANITENQDQKNFIEWAKNGNFLCFGYASVEISGANGGVAKSRTPKDLVG